MAQSWPCDNETAEWKRGAALLTLTNFAGNRQEYWVDFRNVHFPEHLAVAAPSIHWNMSSERMVEIILEKYLWVSCNITRQNCKTKLKLFQSSQKLNCFSWSQTWSNHFTVTSSLTWQIPVVVTFNYTFVSYFFRDKISVLIRTVLSCSCSVFNEKAAWNFTENGLLWTGIFQVFLPQVQNSFLWKTSLVNCATPNL